MLSVVYAECHIQALYAECYYAECSYAVCHGAIHTTVQNKVLCLSLSTSSNLLHHLRSGLEPSPYAYIQVAFVYNTLAV